MNADIEMTMLQHDAEMAAERGAKNRRPILCVDFDGVLHSYTSRWQGPRTISDPPMPGALEFLREAVEHFNVHIYSTRSHYWGGRRAMKRWLRRYLTDEYGDEATNGHFVFCMEDILFQIKWPRRKPPATITLDDRALCFRGRFPPIAKLRAFRPYKLEKEPCDV